MTQGEMIRAIQRSILHDEELSKKEVLEINDYLFANPLPYYTEYCKYKELVKLHKLFKDSYYYYFPETRQIVEDNRLFTCFD